MADLFGRKTKRSRIDPDTAKTQEYNYGDDGRVFMMRAIKGDVHFPVKYHPITLQDAQKLEAGLQLRPGTFQ